MNMDDNHVKIFLDYFLYSMLSALNNIIVFIPLVFTIKVVVNISGNRVGIFVWGLFSDNCVSMFDIN